MTQSEAESSAPDAFLTGLLCLEPVSEGCLSGLLRLWQGPESAKKPEAPCDNEKCLELLERFFALEAFGQRISEHLSESLFHYLSELPPPAAHATDVECDVKTSTTGDIKVECKAN